MKNILINLIAILLSGCTSGKLVGVYDADTKKPIPSAFLYVNECAMFCSFNSSNLYVADDNGMVELQGNIFQGQASLFAGKDGYLLNAYQGNIDSNNEIKIFITPNPSLKIKKLLMRENLFNDYGNNQHLRDFFTYCTEQGIQFFKLPGWEKLSVKCNRIEIVRSK